MGLFDLLQQSIVIMFAGLSIVFVFLTLLILSIKSNQYIIKYFSLDKETRKIEKEKSIPGSLDQRIISAISIAVLEYERDAII